MLRGVLFCVSTPLGLFLLIYLNEILKKMVPEKDHFLYFAYGSNLLKRRIHIRNPSAKFIGAGRLDNHILDFIKYSENWRGASATIVPKNDSCVWGAVWRLHNKDMESLDRQEAVDVNWYFPKMVIITTSEGDKVECRTYQQTVNPPPREDTDPLPLDRRPSSTYLEVIKKGALECALPQHYIDRLKSIPHNGQEATPEMLEKLNQ